MINFIIYKLFINKHITYNSLDVIWCIKMNISRIIKKAEFFYKQALWSHFLVKSGMGHLLKLAEEDGEDEAYDFERIFQNNMTMPQDPVELFNVAKQIEEELKGEAIFNSFEKVLKQYQILLASFRLMGPDDSLSDDEIATKSEDVPALFYGFNNAVENFLNQQDALLNNPEEVESVPAENILEAVLAIQQQAENFVNTYLGEGISTADAVDMAFNAVMSTATEELKEDIEKERRSKNYERLYGYIAIYRQKLREALSKDKVSGKYKFPNHSHFEAALRDKANTYKRNVLRIDRLKNENPEKYKKYLEKRKASKEKYKLKVSDIGIIKLENELYALKEKLERKNINPDTDTTFIEKQKELVEAKEANLREKQRDIEYGKEQAELHQLDKSKPYIGPYGGIHYVTNWDKMNLKGFWDYFRKSIATERGEIMRHIKEFIEEQASQKLEQYNEQLLDISKSEWNNAKKTPEQKRQAIKLAVRRLHDQLKADALSHPMIKSFIISVRAGVKFRQHVELLGRAEKTKLYLKTDFSREEMTEHLSQLKEILASARKVKLMADALVSAARSSDYEFIRGLSFIGAEKGEQGQLNHQIEEFDKRAKQIEYLLAQGVPEVTGSRPEALQAPIQEPVIETPKKPKRRIVSN